MKKKKLKGMSLIEIIISLAVMALLSIILLTVGTTIGNTSKATNKLKNKILQESPYASNRIRVYYTNNPEFDDEGNLVKNADGTDKYIPALKIVRDADGNEVKDDEGKTKTEPVLDAEGKPIYEAVLEGTDVVINVSLTGEYKWIETDEGGTVHEKSETNPHPDINAKFYNTKSVVEGGPNSSKSAENLDLKFIDFVAPTTEASTETIT